MGSFLVLIALLTGWAAPSLSWGSAGITYHGRLISPDGSPVESPNVRFRLQIRSPGSENCLMYEETHTRDMQGSNGVFAITINDGTASSVNEQGLSLDRVFQNRGAFNFASGKCALGNSYAPNPTDGRRLAVEFDDGSFGPGAWEALPAQTINHVPSALESMTVGGYNAGSLLRVHDGSGQPASIPALTNTEYGALTALIAGASSLYATPSSNITGNAAGFTGFLAGDVTGTQGATSVVKLRGRDIDTNPPTNGQVLKWNGPGSRWEATADDVGVTTELDPTVPANLKDGVDWNEVASKPSTFPPSAHLHPFTDLQNGPGAYLDYRPNNVSCATGETLKWNNPQSRWECGVDLGLTSAVASLTVNAPIVNSGSATAPVLGVSDATTSVKGILQLADDNESSATKALKADDPRLSDPRAPSGSAGGDLGETYPNPSVVGIRGTAVSATAPAAAGQVLRYDGTSQYVASNLAISDITNLSAQLGNKLDQSQMPSACGSNQALSFISVTGSWSCTNIANLDASVMTAGVLSTARLGSGTADTSTYLRGDGSWAVVPASTDNLGSHTATQNLALGSNWLSGDGQSEGLRIDANGNVGIGSSAPTEKLDVAGKVNATELCIAGDCKATWPTGSGSTGSLSQRQYFSSSGTFTVPAGVTSVRVSVAGGGGGGAGSTSNPQQKATDGGASSVTKSGVSVSAAGGIGGKDHYYPGGASTLSTSGQALANGSATGTVNSLVMKGGGGAGGHAGLWSSTFTGGWSDAFVNGQDGGNGGLVVADIATTPGESLTITVGAGGAGYGTGTAGSDGAVTVEWGGSGGGGGGSGNNVIDGLVVQGQSSFTTTSACPTYVDVPSSSKSVVFAGSGSVVFDWNYGFYTNSGGGTLRICVDGTCGGETNFYSNEASSHKSSGGSWVTTVASGTHTIKMQVCSRVGTLYANNDDPISWVVHAGTGASGGGSDWTKTGSDLSYGAGNVGIGTMSPAAKLDVAGEIKIGNTSSVCDATNEGQQRYDSAMKKMEFCDGVAWTNLGSGGLGVGQLWTDVSGSRALSIDYTNSTGKPIQVSVILNSMATQQRSSLVIDGATIATITPSDYYNSTSATSHYQTLTAVVPAGAVYSIQISSGTPTVISWMELR